MQAKPALFAGPRHRRLLRLFGRDALDLLHRLSASRLDDLLPGASRAAVFTDEKGKVVDLALVIAREGEIQLLPGRPTVLAGWIQRFVITEDVEIRAAEQVATVEWLDGPAPEMPEAFAAPAALGATALWLDSDPARLETMAVGFTRESARNLDEQSRRAWLFRRGILAPGDGLDERVNALEAGLRPLVDFRKGCYIGQEVIARVENYEKLRRSLAWMSGAGAPPAVGDELRTESGATARVLEVATEGEEWVSLLLADRSIPGGALLARENENAGTLHWAPAHTNSEPSL